MAAIALIFDFDDTLVPDSTSALIESRGIDAADFWTNRTSALVKQGYDPALAYLNRCFKRLAQTGRSANSPMQSLPHSARAWMTSGTRACRRCSMSCARKSQPTAMSRWSSTSSQAAWKPSSADPRSSRRTSVVGTDPVWRGRERRRSRYQALHYVHREDPLLVRDHQRHPDARVSDQASSGEREAGYRRIPLDQMIYVGDGLTDIPCFSLVEGNGGDAFGVFEPGRPSAKATLPTTAEDGPGEGALYATVRRR